MDGLCGGAADVQTELVVVLCVLVLAGAVRKVLCTHTCAPRALSLSSARAGEAARQQQQHSSVLVLVYSLRP